MITSLIPAYFCLLALSVGLGLFVPSLVAWLRRWTRKTARVFLVAATLMLLLLVCQQVAIIIINAMGDVVRLPTPPTSMLLAVLKLAPKQAVEAVTLVWWQEELRFLSALVMALPILCLHVLDRSIRVQGLRFVPGALVTFAGSALFAIPLGLLLCRQGAISAFRAIVTPRRTIGHLPAFDTWLWETSATFVGWGHVWAYALLVPMVGASILMVAMLQIIDAITILKAGARRAGG